MESVYDSAAAEQVLDGSNTGAAGLLLSAANIRPFGRNQRAASVGKNQNEMKSFVTMRVAKDDERLTFKWVVLSRNRDALGKVLGVGSVSCFPSTTLIRRS